MTIHPIAVVDQVIDEYRRYLTTEFRARDAGLRKALEDALDRPRFLAQEPFFQAHRPFKDGDRWDALGLDAKLAAVLAARTGPRAFLHQSEAVRYLLGDGDGSLVVTTGTGSGKSECFLVPVIQNAIDDAVRYRERPGITAILVYPMNALANDQEERVRKYLDASGHTYVKVARYDRSTTQDARAALRKAPPHVLLTNYMMLEYLLVRPADREALFANHRCRFVVLDEVHTYRGSLGTNIALLIRRLGAHLRRAHHDDGPRDPADRHRFPTPRFVATSATIRSVDETGRSPDEVARLRDGAARGFVSALTGVPPELFRVLGEEFRPLEVPPEARWASAPAPVALPPPGDAEGVHSALARLAGLEEGASLDDAVRRCGPLWTMHALLARRPMSVSGIVRAVKRSVPARADVDDATVAAEVRAALHLGASLGDHPAALRLRAHRFLRGGWRFHRCVDPQCGMLHPMGESACACGRATAPLLLCRACGADALHLSGAADPTQGRLTPRNSGDDAPEWMLYRDAVDDEDDDPDDEGDTPTAGGDGRHKGVVRVGSFDPVTLAFSLDRGAYLVKVTLGGRRNRCLMCGSSAGAGSMLTPVALGTSAALRVLAEGVLEALAAQHRGEASHDGKERLLIFSDSRQDAAHQARFISYAGRYDRMRRRVVEVLPKPGDAMELGELLRRLLHLGIERRDNPLTASQKTTFLPKPVQERALAWEEAPLLDDIAVSAAYRATLPNLGLVGVRYAGLRETLARHGAALTTALGLRAREVEYLCRVVLDEMRTRQALSRPMLRYHPMSPLCPEYVDDARWERRVKRPYGFACDEQGRPVGTLDTAKVPEGIGVYNLWRDGGSGGIPRLQRVFRHLVARLGQRQATPDDLLGVVGFLLEHGYVVPSELHGARKSRALLQVNADLLEVARLGEGDRLRCDVCGARAFWVEPATPCRVCRGALLAWDPAEVACNRYVERVLRSDELPLVAGEHTAQITTEARQQLEADFKAPSRESPVNVLACSPTLEMGIDVGGLDAVLMRNVPPRPDNYAQRGGRAGRRSRVGVVVGYARNTPHDQYFFDRPEEMIAGEVAAPLVSLGNRDVLLRHLNAIALGAADPGLAGRMIEYISWKGELNRAAVDALVAAFRAGIDDAVAVARDAWGDALLRDAGFADEGALRAVLDAQPARIADLFERVRYQVMRLHEIAHPYRESGVGKFQALSAEDLVRKILGLRAEGGTDGEADDRGEGHPMRRFAEFGILPGYEFPSEPATLRLARDRHEAEALSVVRRFGIAQYQPDAPVHARGHRWRVAGLDTTSPWNPRDAQPSWRYRLCPGCDLRFDASAHVRCPRCGDANAGGIPLAAFDYGGFLAQRDDRPVLDDEERHSVYARVRTEPQWNGRIAARVRLPGGEIAELRREEEVRWLNEGPEPETSERHAALHRDARGFWLCPRCGRMLKPPAPPAKSSKTSRTPKKVNAGNEDPYGHAGSCPDKGTPPHAHAIAAVSRATTLRLMVEVSIDTDPMEYERWGLSLGYALEAGLRGLYMLDGAELSFVLEPLWVVEDADGRRRRGALTFVDASVGGSGFLDRAATELHLVARRAMEHLRHDGCETACYRCLKSYQNQRHHAQLAWPLAMASLEALAQAAPTTLPTNDGSDPRPWLEAWEAGVGSPLELAFLRALEARGVAVEKQYPLADRPGAAPFTVVDFAIPSRRIAMYVDGRAFHVGSNLRRDRAIRDRLATMDPPWRVESLSVEDLRAGLPSLHDLFGAFESVTDAAVVSSPTPDEIPWPDVWALVDPRWYPLFRALGARRVREPDEAELDLTRNGRVIDVRAVVAWTTPQGLVALVEEEVDCDARCVVARDDGDPGPIADALLGMGVGR